MSRRTDSEAVLDLACLTGDRTDAEQRALLAVAFRVDMERSAQVVTNKNPRPPRFADLVMFSRILDDGQRPVDLSAKQWAQLDRRTTGFVP